MTEHMSEAVEFSINPSTAPPPPPPPEIPVWLLVALGVGVVTLFGILVWKYT